jgi:hypothetical protein
MDNAAPAWELPGPMRWALLALLVVGLLAAPARARATSAARAAVEQANTALAAQPPRHDEARAALQRAIAAADDAPATGEAWLLLGQLDEDDFAFARAVEDDRAAIKAAPDTRWAIRAGDRADWLRARSEGDFAPLARLERVRRDTAAASDPAAIDALARDLEAFPPGTVRVEARMLVAEANLGRLHRPEAALPQLRAGPR